ncbi:hypothetical protein HPB48_009935 [Haemaphysalis longicornis]|uniref:Uncharacterized protein n=1 Tax=Haemaphysalis longicornis TaxID=44386 RepID=A0A9J6GS02_HAELO|nr:hypothetical protein HPB48_009935 [Haemaphysalis longicornis]
MSFGRQPLTTQIISQAPSQHSLAGPLLDLDYEAANVSIPNSTEKASCITNVPDGGTNVEGVSVIYFVLCTPSPLLFKSINTDQQADCGLYD